MEDGRIPDEALSHNVEFNVNVPVTSYVNNSRLNKKVTMFPSGWMASNDREEWLQIDLGSMNQVYFLSSECSFNSFMMAE